MSSLERSWTANEALVSDDYRLSQSAFAVHHNENTDVELFEATGSGGPSHCNYTPTVYDVLPQEDNPALEIALRYAGLGYPVFPCYDNSKIPATLNGLKNATTDPEQIYEWFTDSPHYNVAIQPSRNILVVDIDDPPLIVRFLGRYPEMRDAPYNVTPQGGQHRYLQFPEGVPPLKTAKRINGEKVDVQGLGKAYVLVYGTTKDGCYREGKPPVATHLLPVASTDLVNALRPGAELTRLKSAKTEDEPDSSLSYSYIYIESGSRSRDEEPLSLTDQIKLESLRTSHANQRRKSEPFLLTKGGKDGIVGANSTFPDAELAKALSECNGLNDFTEAMHTHWPRIACYRHLLALYVSVGLYCYELDEDEALEEVKGACLEAGDDELGDRLNAVRMTYWRIRNGLLVDGIVGRRAYKTCFPVTAWGPDLNSLAPKERTPEAMRRIWQALNALPENPKTGMRRHSTRSLVEQTNLSRNTVVRTLKGLQKEKAIRWHAKKGSRLLKTPVVLAEQPQEDSRAKRPAPTPHTPPENPSKDEHGRTPTPHPRQRDSRTTYRLKTPHSYPHREAAA